ncbi:MAG: hypothetical protein AAFW82_09490 [Pseudomonadota bacterium]
MILWSLIIAISIALLAYTAGQRSEGVEMAYVNIAIAAITSFIFVILALRSNQRLRTTAASRMAIAADTAFSMGLVYMWGTIGLAIIYGTGILTWKEWWHFLLAFLAIGTICLIMAAMMHGKAKAAQEDEKLLTYGDYGAITQMIGMTIVVLGLLIDGKMVRFMHDQRANWQDWGANNIFFFGAAALIVISAHALWTRKRVQN